MSDSDRKSPVRSEPFRSPLLPSVHVRAKTIPDARFVPLSATFAVYLDSLSDFEVTLSAKTPLTIAIKASFHEMHLKMITRIPRWLPVCLFLLGLGTPVAQAQDGIDFNEAENMFSYNVVELRDQLRFGLRVAFPEQEAFINEVAAKVDSGELSRAMVNVVFVWSKKRNPRIPFPYFETVLRLLAEKRGVTFTSGT